ncbi:MAG: TolC family protein, partial [Spirochaetales bacterium]|nr:TolC family protein [Spirochaetales bacterium]
MKLKNNLIMICIAFVCAVASYCVDNESKTPEVPVNLDDCIELGLMDSSILRSAFLDSRSAEALLAEMRMQYVPSIIVSGGYTRLSETDPAEITLPAPLNSTVTLSPSITDNFLINVALQQPLFTGFRISSGIKQA